MTSRPAGRHRKGAVPQIPWTPQIPWSPQRLTRPQGPLLLGYPPLLAPSGGRQALRATVARDRRMFTIAMSAAAAGVTAAVLFGSFAPRHSTWMPSGGSGAGSGGQPPQPSAPWSAAPLGIQSGSAVPGPSQGQPLSPSLAPPLSPSLRPALDQPRRPAQPPQHARPPDASQRTGPYQDALARPGVGTRKKTGADIKAKKETGPGQGPGASPAVTPGRHRRAPALAVSYLVGRRWPGGSQGEVQVINHGARPVAGWQIAVALPGDTVTSVWNANGFVSHHILLLGPASADQIVPPTARWTSSSRPQVPTRSQRPAPSTARPAPIDLQPGNAARDGNARNSTGHPRTTLVHDRGQFWPHRRQNCPRSWSRPECRTLESGHNGHNGRDVARPGSSGRAAAAGGYPCRSPAQLHPR